MNNIVVDRCWCGMDRALCQHTTEQIPERIPEQLRREVARTIVIQRAVNAAEAVLQDWIDEQDGSKDEEAYLWYKAGGNLMMKGVESIDKRVFINDLMGTRQLKVTPATEPEVPAAVFPPCVTCGRQVADKNEHATFGVPTCLGCFRTPQDCNCVKLASHKTSQS